LSLFLPGRKYRLRRVCPYFPSFPPLCGAPGNSVQFYFNHARSFREEPGALSYCSLVLRTASTPPPLFFFCLRPPGVAFFLPYFFVFVLRFFRTTWRRKVSLAPPFFSDWSRRRDFLVTKVLPGFPPRFVGLFSGFHLDVFFLPPRLVRPRFRKVFRCSPPHLPTPLFNCHLWGRRFPFPLSLV